VFTQRKLWFATSGADIFSMITTQCKVSFCGKQSAVGDDSMILLV